ncbi:hypothetical protein ACGGZK_15855 [Agromyces sp. MMS24-K17]|uniref:hypothetical protein n=1 Tax=Agromyces sp. MMS24-K17 TaxID=3372850 RepID=UPI0037540756
MPAPSVPEASPAASAEQPTASVEATPEVVAVVLRPERLDLVDAARAELEQLSYDLDAAVLVAELTTVFGTAPAIEESPADCCEVPRTTIYRWPGFEVWDDHMGRFDDADPTVWIDEDVPDDRDMNVVIIVTAPAVGAIPVTTSAGFAIGDDPSGLAGAISDFEGLPFAGIPMETGAELGPPEIEGSSNAYSVVLQAYEGAAGFPRLIAPLNVGVPSV